MTDTPDLRTLAIEAATDVTYAGVQLGRGHAGAIVRAVLSAVEPVIRRSTLTAARGAILADESHPEYEAGLYCAAGVLDAMIDEVDRG